MEKFLIQGGIPLKGEIDISGGKNSSLPILCASILSRGVSTIKMYLYSEILMYFFNYLSHWE